jgi:hypothetical protein
VRLTDDGRWQEVPEDTYRAYLASHPRREHLKMSVWDKGDRGPMWFAYDAEAFEDSARHRKSETTHMVAYRLQDAGDGRMRFWIPVA